MTDDDNTIGSTADSGSRRALVIGIIVIVAAFVGALVFLNRDDDESAVDSTTEPTQSAATTEPPTTEPSTTEPSTTEPSTTEPSEPPTTETSATDAPTSSGPPTSDLPSATGQAIWPWANTSTRFDEPVAAATSFAVDYLGFTDPRVGEFQAGDSRSGEVPVRPGVVGPTTVVFVRQLTDDSTWWVLGAAAENITIDTPDQGASVSSPLTIAGTALAFEGTVDVELRADDHGEPIATDFVTGSGGPEPGPFEDEIEFTSPGAGGGALVLISRSSEDGAPVLEAAARRIFFE